MSVIRIPADLYRADLSAAPAPSPPHPTSDGRDRAVDLVRSLCVLAVITLHALMVGVTVQDGAPLFGNAAENGSWLTPLSWPLQVMPLFFVIGGFAGITALRRREDGGARFAAARVHRLLLPATAVVATVGVLLAVLARAGVSDEIVSIAGYRFGQPLWFLGVFLLSQALLPALARRHARRPIATLLALVVAAMLVDAARAVTGVDAIGFLNLAFVWLSLQQVGFFLADGRIDALRRRTRIIWAVAATAGLAGSFLAGIHSPDLIANLNPPTTALLLVGMAHTALFSLFRGRITVLAARPRVAAFTDFVSGRTMTVYLWHMPVLLALAGVLALTAMATGVALPEPASVEWWMTRPLWLVAALALTALLSLPLTRIEAAPQRLGPVSMARAVVAVTLGLVGVVLLLAVGTSPVTAAIATLLWVVALRMIRPPRAISPLHPIGLQRPRGRRSA